MKWYVAHLGKDRASLQLHKQIISRFNQIYESAGEPEGVALYEAVDSFGQMHALCLNPAAVKYSAPLFEESSPWIETENIGMFNIHWVAGDKRLNRRS